MPPARPRFALAVLVVAGVAAADPTPAQIKEAASEFDQGVSAVRTGDPDGAAMHFEKADSLAPSDAAIRAAIRARRDAKQPARAASLAALAAARHPDNLELQTLAREVMDSAAKQTGQITVSCKPACELVVDRKLVHGGAAKGITLFLDPGKHSLAAGWGEKSASKSVVAVAGEASTVAFARPSDPAPTTSAAAEETTEAPKAEPASGLPRGVFYGGLALTAVLAGVTTWSGLDAKNNPGADAVRVACAGKGTACPEYQDGLSRQHRTNALLVATGVVGVATAVVGAFFTRWSDDDAASQKGSSVTPLLTIGSSGATVGAGGRF